jgi:TolB-like protein
VITTLGGLAVLLALIVGFRAAKLRERLLRPAAAGPIKSLAVLPLQNLSADPEQEYFADGMTEQLTTDLGQISALRVISRTSAMHYKGTNKTLPEIARELHVDAVVEGSVERSGNQVRVTAQLIEAPTDRHLWAKSYDCDLHSVLALQDEVVQAIVKEVRVKLTPEEQSHLANAAPGGSRSSRGLSEGTILLEQEDRQRFKEGAWRSGAEGRFGGRRVALFGHRLSLDGVCEARPRVGDDAEPLCHARHFLVAGSP